jgi:hypothetical protein
MQFRHTLYARVNIQTLTGRNKVFMSRVMRRFMKIQKASSSSLPTLAINVLAIKFMP